MLFWKLPCLICKNDEALRKAGVPAYMGISKKLEISMLAYRFDTPYAQNGPKQLRKKTVQTYMNTFSNVKLLFST